MTLTTIPGKAFPLIAASLTAGLSLTLSGCSATSKTSAPASMTSAIKSDVDVCDLVDAQRIEEATSSQLTKFAYEHTPAPANQPPSKEAILPNLHCRIYFPDDTIFSKIEIHYQGRAVDDFGESVATVPFDQAIQNEEVERISSSDVEGQGFTYENNTSGPLLAWSYPDGHVLTMRVSYAVRDGENTADLHQNVRMLISFFELVGDRIPQVASGPKQELTFYPEDSDSLRDTKSPRPEG